MLILKILFFVSKKLYIITITLSAKDNQKLSKILSERFERSGYWNKNKSKCENNDTTNKYRYFLKSNFIGVNRLFVLAYLNQDDNIEIFKAQQYYLSKVIIRTNNAIINRKNFYD